jgi:O-antigen/teichoic acid export membrane protein
VRNATLEVTMVEAVGATRLARNSLLTLTTSLFLLVATVVLVPLMLHAFGRELYGLLSVTWLLLAHLGWLDFGLSRAIARFVAQDLSRNDLAAAATRTWVAVFTQFALGGIAAVVLFVLAPTLVASFDVAEENQGLATETIRLFAVAVPFELSTRSLSGALEAGQRFGWINVLRVFGTVWTYALFAIALGAGDDFRLIVYGLFALRPLTFAAFLFAVSRLLPLGASIRHFKTPKQHWRLAVEIVRFGSWITLGAIVGPVLMYFDQWMISLYLGVAMLPLYAIPLSFLARLQLFPSSMTQILFPAFSALQAGGRWETLEAYFVRAHRYLAIPLIPVTFLIYVWTPEVLRVWIDDSFADQASTPARILLIGFLIGLFAPLSGALLDALGRPDLVAKIYLVELPLNIAAVVVLVWKFGLSGAAVSFAIRSVLETAVLWVVVYKVVPLSPQAIRLIGRSVAQFGTVASGMAVAAYLLRHSAVEEVNSVALSGILICAYVPLATLLLLDSRDRDFIRSVLRRSPAV